MNVAQIENIIACLSGRVNIYRLFEDLDEDTYLSYLQSHYWVQVCIDVSIDRCACMCVDMSVDMCIPPVPTEPLQGADVYMHTHTYRHVHCAVCMCAHVCVHVCAHVHTSRAYIATTGCPQISYGTLGYIHTSYSLPSYATERRVAAG